MKKPEEMTSEELIDATVLHATWLRAELTWLEGKYWLVSGALLASLLVHLLVWWFR